MEDIPFINHYCYTSSPQPEDVPIEELLCLSTKGGVAEAAGAEQPMMVPIDNPFCTGKLMAGYARLAKADPRVKLTHILKGEPVRGYFKMDPAYVKQILDFDEERKVPQEP